MVSTGAQHSSIAYNLCADSEWRLVGLYGICFLSFIVAVLLMLVVIGLGWMEGDLMVAVVMGVIFGAPIVVYYLLRKRTRKPITITLSAEEITIEKSSRRISFRADSIKSIESFFNDGETYDTHTVIIRPMVGKPVKFYSSTSSGSIHEMGAFRKDFEAWAAAKQIKTWSPWYRRSWGTGK